MPSRRWRTRLEADLTGDLRALAQLRSASGPSAGRYLTDHPDGEPTLFDDTEWRWALRWRAGLPLTTRDGECGHRTKGAE